VSDEHQRLLEEALRTGGARTGGQVEGLVGPGGALVRPAASGGVEIVDIRPARGARPAAGPSDDEDGSRAHTPPAAG
jgi:hypothetical protein